MQRRRRLAVNGFPPGCCSLTSRVSREERRTVGDNNNLFKLLTNFTNGTRRTFLLITPDSTLSCVGIFGLIKCVQKLQNIVGGEN